MKKEGSASLWLERMSHEGEMNTKQRMLLLWGVFFPCACVFFYYYMSYNWRKSEARFEHIRDPPGYNPDSHNFELESHMDYVLSKEIKDCKSTVYLICAK